LGSQKYHTAIDIWALGCIFGELLKHEPLMQGKTELDQLELIYRLLGTPNEKIWPGFSKLNRHSTLAEQTRIFPPFQYNNINAMFPNLSENGVNLLTRMLTYDPSKRITAQKALNHPYFTEPPFPTTAEMMPTFPSQSTRRGAAGGKRTLQPTYGNAGTTASRSSLSNAFDDRKVNEVFNVTTSDASRKRVKL